MIRGEIRVARSDRINSEMIQEKAGKRSVRDYEFVRTRWEDASVGISERYYSR